MEPYAHQSCPWHITCLSSIPRDSRRTNRDICSRTSCIDRSGACVPIPASCRSCALLHARVRPPLSCCSRFAFCLGPINTFAILMRRSFGRGRSRPLRRVLPSAENGEAGSLLLRDCLLYLALDGHGALRECNRAPVNTLFARRRVEVAIRSGCL